MPGYIDSFTTHDGSGFFARGNDVHYFSFGVDIDPTGGYDGGRCLIGSGSGYIAIWTFDTWSWQYSINWFYDDTTFPVSTAHWLMGTAYNNAHLPSFLPARLLGVRVLSDGSLEVYRHYTTHLGLPPAIIGTSAPGAVKPSKWNKITFEGNADPGRGMTYVAVKVRDVEVLRVSGIELAFDGIDGLQYSADFMTIGVHSLGGLSSLDKVRDYIYHGWGENTLFTPTTEVLGDIKIIWLPTNGAGEAATWTVVGGSDWSATETNDGDGSYLETTLQFPSYHTMSHVPIGAFDRFVHMQGTLVGKVSSGGAVEGHFFFGSFAAGNADLHQWNQSVTGLYATYGGGLDFWAGLPMTQAQINSYFIGVGPDQLIVGTSYFRVSQVILEIATASDFPTVSTRNRPFILGA
jgi:hypothetical protein